METPQQNSVQPMPMQPGQNVLPVNRKQVPVGVKIVAVLNYIGGAIGILAGILSFIFAFAFGSSQIPILGSVGMIIFIIIGLVMLGLGVLSLFIGRGLWKGKKWARIIVIIFSIIGILGMIISLVMGGSIFTAIPTLIYEGVIGGYLLFNKKVKEVFSSG